MSRSTREVGAALVGIGVAGYFLWQAWSAGGWGAVGYVALSVLFIASVALRIVAYSYERELLSQLQRRNERSRLKRNPKLH